jgi:bacillithiol biosynthesis cysteine-adding enzyme BshC
VSRLFADYVSGTGNARQLLPPPGSFEIQQTAIRKLYDDSRRQRVCDVLSRQSGTWDASEAVIGNIERIRRGAACAVTGQQVGLFGGPLYSLFKALSVIRLAEQATASGVDCVPVFWLATTDHDLEEVNVVNVVAGDGSLHSLHAQVRGSQNAPMASVLLDQEITLVVDRLEALLGPSEAVDLARRCYTPGVSLGTAFARLLARLFGAWGLVVLDPSDQELHRAAEPVYRQAIERSGELHQALMERGKQLRAYGYHEQVNVEASSLLFVEYDGSRTAIRSSNDAGCYRIGQERIGKEELLRRIVTEPERFSPNVLLRPVVQDYLLPTIVYIGGPAEVAYFAQLAVIQQSLIGHVTPIVPRFSATLVEPKAGKLLERYHLALADVFQGPDHVRHVLAEHAMPTGVRLAFEGANASLESSIATLETELRKLDSTLLEAAKHAAAKMRYQLHRLRARAEAAEIRRSELLKTHASYLANLLFPNKDLQERQIGGISFLARHGTGVLENLYELVRTDCPDHHILYL